MSQANPTTENKLLKALPDAEYQRLAPHLTPVSLEVKQILHQPDELMTQVYFPNNALISLVSILKDGSSQEIGLVGSEGMVGLPVILRGNSTISQAVVQIAGSAMKLSAEVLKQEFKRGQHLQNLLLLYTQARLTQVTQLAVCNTQFSLQERLACWLLSVSDCIKQDQFTLTQELIANMLGVRRSSVTVVANRLQDAGIIRYRRGKITILNQKCLEEIACESYHLVKREYSRLLGD